MMLNCLPILGNEGFQLGAASFLQTVLESFHFIKVALEEKNNNKVALDHYRKKKKTSKIYNKVGKKGKLKITCSAIIWQ